MFLVIHTEAEFPIRNQRPGCKPLTTVNCTVRKYLTAREIEKLMDYARKHSRYGHRDEWALSAQISQALPQMSVETGLAGWGERTRTQKCRRELSL